MVIRSFQVPAVSMPGNAQDADPLQEQAAEAFAEQLVANQVPLIRVIRTQFHVGQPRVQRLREYLRAGAGNSRAPLISLGANRPESQSVTSHLKPGTARWDKVPYFGN